MIALTNALVQDASGNPLIPNGYIELYLSQDAVVGGSPPNGLVLGGTTNFMRFYCGPDGNLLPGYEIWSNEELIPDDTYYVANYYDENGTLLNNGPVQIQFTGTPIPPPPPTPLFTKVEYTGLPTRVLGTVYQNTSGQPIIVCGGEESDGGSMTAYCAAANPPTVIVNEGYGFYNQWFPFVFIVPNGFYYKVVNTGSPTLQGWTEYKINVGSVVFSGELSGSRAVGSTYRNISGSAMLVVADILDPVPTEVVSAICDSTPAPTTVVSEYKVNEGGNQLARDLVVIMVPNGSYYKIAGASASVLHWNEYVLPFNAVQSTELAGHGRIYDTNYTNGTKDLFATASGRTPWLGQVSAGAAALNTVTLISTWLSDDAVTWLIAQPGDVYFQTAGIDGTLSHWFEYELSR